LVHLTCLRLTTATPQNRNDVWHFRLPSVCPIQPVCNEGRDVALFNPLTSLVRLEICIHGGAEKIPRQTPEAGRLHTFWDFFCEHEGVTNINAPSHPDVQKFKPTALK